MNKQISINKFPFANIHPHFHVEKYYNGKINPAIYFVIFDLTKTTVRSSPIINQ